MTVEHLIELLKRFDGKEKVFVKTYGWDGINYTEVDTSMGIEIMEEDVGIVIDLDL